MSLSILIIVVVILITFVFLLPLAYAATTYNFTHCYKQIGSNYIVYYCIGDAPHQRTVFYMELANP